MKWKTIRRFKIEGWHDLNFLEDFSVILRIDCRLARAERQVSEIIKVQARNDGDLTKVPGTSYTLYVAQLMKGS